MLRITWNYGEREYVIHSIISLRRDMTPEHGVIVEIAGQGPMYLHKNSMDHITKIELVNEEVNT